MVARAEAKYIRISSYRVRQASRLIKGLSTQKASAVLKSVNKKGALYLEKVLHSAVSNAKNKGLEEATLFVSRAVANSGPVLKRYRAASFGRATMIRKKTSHIIVELDTKEANEIKSVKKGR